MNISDNLSSEARRNLEMLEDFFRVPADCNNPKEFLRKRRALAIKLYVATQTQVPASSLPQRYDPKTHLRTSPDIERFSDSDGVWYHASGIRDEVRSPKQDLSKYIFFNSSIISQ